MQGKNMLASIVIRGENAMVKLEIFDPSGAIEVTKQHAPRLSSLEGKHDMQRKVTLFPRIRCPSKRGTSTFDSYWSGYCNTCN